MKIDRAGVVFYIFQDYTHCMYKRILNMAELSGHKSFFLFGPRSTGKTTLIHNQFPDHSVVNLLSSSAYLSLAENPSILTDIVKEQERTQNVVIIDEIQKLPILLDEIHHLIESLGIHFIMTGSSARKLRRAGVNLLGGRAWQAHLFPLVSREIDDFRLEKYLLYGGLPQVYTSEYPEEELDAYVHTYLQEEITAEALVQNQVQFSRFLKVASLSNAEQLNYAAIASDAGVPASTVRSYFSILSDTFLGFLVESWQGSKKRKAAAAPKFYFFDLGVSNFLSGTRTLQKNTSEFGKIFEHFIAMELRAWLSYRRSRKPLRYWRARTGYEVDFLLGEDAAIEVKSAHSVKDKHLKGLRALKEENIFSEYILVSFDEMNRETPDGIRCLHWSRFLEMLWDDAFGWQLL